YNVNNFNIEVTSNLKELYELGKEIMKKENSDLFLEDKTLDLLYLYGLPIAGASFDCGDKIWIKSDLKEKTKNVLAVGLPFVGVRNTNFGGYNNEMRMFEWDVTSRNYDVDVDVLFYQNWPFEFDVNPSKGEIVRGDSVKQTYDFGIFCIARYHFVYDLEFPVVIKMEKDGDEMFFATKVKIVSNNPRENDLVYGYEDEKFCNENLKKIKINEDFDINVLCEDNICSKEVVDGEVEVPDCGGVIVASKEGYVSEDKVVSDEMEFELEKISKMKFKVRKQNKSGEYNLKDNEMVIINLINEEKNFESYAVSSQMDEIELVEGKYNVNMMLIKEGKFKFPGKTIEYCIGIETPLGCAGTKKSVKIPAVDLDQVVVGGAEYEHAFKKEDLEKDSLVFYVYEDKVKKIDDVGKVMEKLEKYGEKVKKVEAR
ncbi:hypothetical protein CL618_03510, partial [archaeon]|nr:hypothetical protein [archaeon]